MYQTPSGGKLSASTPWGCWGGAGLPSSSNSLFIFLTTQDFEWDVDCKCSKELTHLLLCIFVALYLLTCNTALHLLHRTANR